MTSEPSPAQGVRASRADARTIALACAIAILWLTTRPYLGVVQDARFYMLEALRIADPERFAKDLYFAFGSQGNFSLFSRLYPPLIGFLGVGVTGTVMTVAGQLLWLFGLFCLIRAVMAPSLEWLSAAVVIGLLNIYAPYFGYGEAFATARLFAEGLTMLALAWLPVRAPWALALLVPAATLHPLMALPGIAVALVYLALGRPLWWAVIAAGAALTVALGLFGVAPFANLFRTMDPAWFAVVSVRETQCLISRWPIAARLQVLGLMAWAVAALVLAGRQHRRFLMAVFVVGVGGVVCTFVGGDLLHNVLVIELQPWRSLWLLEVVTRIYIPLVVGSVLARTSFGGLRATVLLTMALIVTASVTRLVRYPNSAEFTSLSLVLTVVALALLTILLLSQAKRPVVPAAIVVGLGLLATALWRWDIRMPWTRFVESSTPAPAELTALLPANASVYWEDSVETLWLRLKRSSYFSCDQGTGAVFYRDTAITYRHRADSFWPLRTGDFTQSSSCASFDRAQKPQRSRAGLQKLCRREPELDYLVLTAPLAGIPAREWKPPLRFQDAHMSDGAYSALVTDKFYIYACSQVR